MPSEAGHYGVTYSGGTVTVTGTNPACGRTTEFVLASGFYGGAGTAGVCLDPPPVPGTETVVCQGTVTLTFTWTLDAPGDTEAPPGSVVVKRTSTATWSADGGTADNGLGDPALPPTGYSQTSAGVEWTAVNDPGTVFTIEVSPSASCTFTVGGASGMQSGSASVSLKGEAFPVRIAFSGTTDVGVPAVQIGQKLTSTVVGIPGDVLDDDPLTEPNDTYAWDEPPGHPFLDYRPELLPTTFQPWADPGTPSMVTYFGKGAPLSADASQNVSYSIRCVVSLPRYNLTLVPKRPIVVYRPGYAFDEPLGNPRIDRMYLLRGNSQPYVEDPVSPEWMKLWGLTPPTPPPVAGTKHGATVRMWVEGPPGFGNELGQWNYTQLVAARYHVKHSNGFDQVHNTDWGVWGLDWAFPYPGDGGPHIAVENLPKTWADSPGLTLADAPEWNWYFLSDTFRHYVFYLPPGAEARWVPLRIQPWMCEGTATHGSPWSLSQGTNAWIPFAVIYPWPFPMWSVAHGNGPVQWTPGPPP